MPLSPGNFWLGTESDPKMRELTDEDYQTLATLRHALRRFLQFSERAARAVGLTPNQHQALLQIRGCPPNTPMTVGRLAETMLRSPHSTSELVTRLEHQGLVRRTKSGEDSRVVLICLSEPALALLHELTAAHRQELKRLGPELVKLLHQIDESAGD